MNKNQLVSSNFYRIFGWAINIVGADESLSRLINEELSLYPRLKKATEPDLVVNIGHQLSSVEAISINPSAHIEHTAGFIADFGYVKINYALQSVPLIVDVALNKSNLIKRVTQRAISIQFTTIEEQIGQIIHELVLLPLIYLIGSKFILHAAAFKAKDNGIYLGG